MTNSYSKYLPMNLSLNKVFKILMPLEQIMFHPTKLWLAFKPYPNLGIVQATSIPHENRWMSMYLAVDFWEESFT